MKFVRLNKNLYCPDENYQKKVLIQNPKVYRSLVKNTDVITQKLQKLFEGYNRTYDADNYEDLSNYIMYIAVENKEIVGMIYATRFHNWYVPPDPHSWTIDFVIVDKNHIREGIGTKLYLTCINDIVNRGGTKIWANFIDEKGRNLFNKVAKILNHTTAKENKMYDLCFPVSKQDFEHLKSKKPKPTSLNFEREL